MGKRKLLIRNIATDERIGDTGFRSPDAAGPYRSLAVRIKLIK